MTRRDPQKSFKRLVADAKKYHWKGIKIETSNKPIQEMQKKWEISKPCGCLQGYPCVHEGLKEIRKRSKAVIRRSYALPKPSQKPKKAPVASAKPKNGKTDTKKAKPRV